MSSKVEDGKRSSRTMQSTAPAERSLSAAHGWHSGKYSLGRRLIFLLVTALGLAGAVAMQAQLGTYATSGGGAAQVQVPPGTVALSLALCIGVALLLSWRDVPRWWHRRRLKAVSGRYPAQARTRTQPARARTAPSSAPSRTAQQVRPTAAQAGRTMRPATHPRRSARVANHAGAAAVNPGIGSLLRARLAALRCWRVSDLQQTWRGFLCVLLLLLALLASLIADLGAQTPAGRPVAQWWWIASVLLLLLAASLYVWLKRRAAMDARQRALRKTSKTPAQENRQRVTISARQRIWKLLADPLLLSVLLLAALLLRLPGLTDQPYIVHGDEAACGLEAYRWLNGGVPSLLSVGWYGLPVLGYGYPALVMRLAGVNLFGLRLSSVIIGVLCVLLLYALAREFAGRRVAFVAAALLATAHIAIQFSRMGIHYIHAPFVVLLTLWMLVRALRKNSALAAVMAGIGLSLAMQVYFSARIVFAIIPLFLIGLFLLYPHFLKGRLFTLGWMALSLLISFGPLGVYFLHDTDALEARPAQVLILNLTPGMLSHLISQFGTANLSAVLLRQFAAVPLLVGGLADQSLQYGPLYAMFDALAAALMTIGFFYALFHLKRPLCLLLVVWVICTVMLGGVLTIDMPWWPRLLVMVPALCLLAALVLEEMLRAAERFWRGLEWVVMPAVPGQRWRAAVLGAMLALAVIVYSGGQSIQHYFIDYPQEVNGVTWRAQYTDIGRYLAQLPAGTYVILLSDDSVIWDYATFQFLAPQVQGARVGSASELQSALARHAGPVIVIITPIQAGVFHALLSTPGALPPGQYLAQPGAQGQVAFYTYAISSR